MAARSRVALTAAVKDWLDSEKRTALTAEAATDGARFTRSPRRVACFVVHGISPIQRYSIQDQFADGLMSALAAARGGQWCGTVFWPRGTDRNTPRPSAIRIAREGDDTTYDVYEGYWSPLTKGRTNIQQCLTWLVRATFLGSSATARLPAKGRKIAWDFGYVGALLAGASAPFVFAGMLLTVLWPKFFDIFRTDASGDASPTPVTLDALLAAAQKISPTGYVAVILTVAIGFLVAHIFNFAIHSVRRISNRRSLAADITGNHVQKEIQAAQRWQRITAIALTIFAGALLLLQAWLLRDCPAAANWVCWGIPALVALVQAGRALADLVVEQVLGDVAVYTTHDCNAADYAVREQVVSTVTESLLGVFTAETHDSPTKPATGGNAKPTAPYDEVHVFGHSLGSTVALDVLLRVRQLVQEQTINSTAWEAIRSFVTFGTALEKTKFFFDVRHPTTSAAHDQWDADAYGRFFEAGDMIGPQNRDVVRWTNLWYTRDIVANEIVSYETDVRAGGQDFAWSGNPPRKVCFNIRLDAKKPLYAFVHGDYLSDEEFWAHVVDIV